MSTPPLLAIEVKKLAGYLLDVHHPIGGNKAAFFVREGFDPSDPEKLASALADHAIMGWPGQVSTWPGAVRHQIDAPMRMPTGNMFPVRSVWEHRHGVGEARLITAFRI